MFERSSLGSTSGPDSSRALGVPPRLHENLLPVVSRQLQDSLALVEDGVEAKRRAPKIFALTGYVKDAEYLLLAVVGSERLIGDLLVHQPSTSVLRVPFVNPLVKVFKVVADLDGAQR